MLSRTAVVAVAPQAAAIIASMRPTVVTLPIVGESAAAAAHLERVVLATMGTCQPHPTILAVSAEVACLELGARPAVIALSVVRGAAAFAAVKGAELLLAPRFAVLTVAAKLALAAL